MQSDTLPKKQKSITPDRSRDDSCAHMERRRSQDRRRLTNIADEYFMRQRQKFDDRSSRDSSSSSCSGEGKDFYKKTHSQFIRNIGENRIKRSR